MSAKMSRTSPGKDSGRLFFPLTSAAEIPKCLFQVPPRKESTKGSLMDLWDKGIASGWQMGAYYLAIVIPALVGLVGTGILLFLRQFWAAGAFLGVALLGAVVLFGDPKWVKLDIDFSFVLITVGGLLSVEWLTRKLLKLA